MSVDAALGEDLDERQFADAQRELHVGAVSLPAGDWAPPAERPMGALGLLVVRGMGLRQLELAGRTQAQLVGPGDLLDPWSGATADLRPAPWRLLDPVVLVVVDGPTLLGAQRFPPLANALVRRLVERSEQLAALAALIQLPRVDLRLLAVLWHLAQRWGRMGTDGLLLHLPLTHEALGHLVGARRPSITLALQQLDAAGLLRRRDDGEWVLDRETGDVLQRDGDGIDAALSPVEPGDEPDRPAGGG